MLVIKFKIAKYQMWSRSLLSLKKITVILILGFIYQSGNAQISQGGVPFSLKNSFLKSGIEVPVHKTGILNVDALLAEDKDFPTPMRYSVFEELGIEIKSEGLKTEIPEEDGSIWRYRIETNNAKAVQIYFREFLVPPGAKLFIYNDDYSEIYGAFTQNNMHSDNSLMIADFDGAYANIEYFEPNDNLFDGILLIGGIGQAYKDIKKSGFSEDANGYINVNCPEGEDWQEAKHSVCRFTFVEGTSGYVCSGSLLNNVKNDGTPFFLTANHCLETETAAGTVIVYFNYEHIACDGPVQNGSSLSGASLLASAAASDYTLLLLDETPTAAMLPYYSGWDVSGDSGSVAVGIHHPEGGPKKISIDLSGANNYGQPIQWQGNTITPPDSHWSVSFDEGNTNTGSSGSPLFNEKGQVIGQLHGGDEEIDYYGKINYSWNIISITGKTLKSFLDPDGTDTLSLGGYFPSSNKPDPQFYPEFKNICDSAGIKLSGFSAFNPQTWEWSFSPDDVSYLEGTDSYSENPVVGFNSIADYNVTLNITNDAGSVNRTFNRSISVGNNLTVDVQPIGLKDSCLCNTDSLIFIAKGARNFKWSMSGNSLDYYQIENDTLNPIVIKRSDLPDSTVNFTINATGTHGKCVSEKNYELTLIKQQNDMLGDAIEIFVGKNGPYSNECATIEESEPIPPYFSCTGQESWCDEYGTGEDIIENSVWFYFIAEESRDYEFNSKLMDNQIALYEAENIESILAGNYELLGANDDLTTVDFNPKIKRVSLIEGQKYWLQVDGSAGGAIGVFELEIKALFGVNTETDIKHSKISLYPQPAQDKVILEWDEFSDGEQVKLDIYNSSGVKVLAESYMQHNSNKLELDISEWSSGIYFILLEKNSLTRTLKMVK